MNAYQKKIQELLIKSTLTNGNYTPSEFVKTCRHAAVLLNGHPVYLSGPADDAESRAESDQLAMSAMFATGLKSIGLTGELSSGIVDGADIKWMSSYSAVVRSEEGVVEYGDEDGELVGINLTQSLPLTVLMCVNSSIAQILDPECPELDDGHELSRLAAECQS